MCESVLISLGEGTRLSRIKSDHFIQPRSICCFLKYRFVHFLHVTLPPSNFGRKSLYVSQLLYNGCGYPPVIAYHSLREIKTLSVFMALNRLYTLEIKSQKFSFLNVSFGKYALELNKNGCVNGMKAR